MLKAPWTPEQIEKLNHYQQLGYVHEYTCANNHDENRVLVAMRDGWVCPTCDYTQDWAHASSLQPPPDPILVLRKLAGDV
jgi:hypothetical protein